ncbi:MAG TPA: hypothetical protein VK171_06600, partial [Fimbriimonas sp.]|nr:hypothetical protein [Fimbriimonas sp.]
MSLSTAILMIHLQHATTPDIAQSLKEHENKIRATIEREFRMPGSKFYRELIKDGKPGKDIAFLWCHAVQMS